METLLREEIETEIGELGNMELGSDGYRKTVDGVTKLIEKDIELQKLEQQAYENEQNRKMEYDLKMQQMIEDKKDRRVKNLLTGLSIAVPAGITVWGVFKSFEFEKEGTITSTMGRMFMSLLKLKK